MKELIIREAGEKVYEYISKFTDVEDRANLFVSTTSKFNIENQPTDEFNTITNLRRINDIRWINKFFEAVNSKLPIGGIFISCAETYNLRKRRIIKKYPPVLNYIYYFFDWTLKRVFPKVFILKKIYFFLTKGLNRVLSKAETFGRLYSCGFEVEEEIFLDNLLFFVARKVKEPVFDYHPTYGPLVRLKRYGKNGKIIKVYKMRTMHAYSEYLQSYVFEKNNLQEGGKFKNDFRVSTVGKVMRKFWIDELPMLFNLLKGDLKLFGVRPLSQQYFDLYDDDFKKIRLKYRPGLVPPFYVDLPKTLDEIMDSERRYLEAYDKHPFRTDWKYFWKAFHNIVFKHARSN
ncbi:sugar transferase [Bacteroidota bacterium]